MICFRRIRAKIPCVLLISFCLEGIASDPPTLAEALASMGVGIDHASLCRALRDPRPTVRGLAASELAEQHDKIAVPQIEEAFDQETNVGATYNLALSLTQFGVDKGKKRLELFCDDPSVGIAFRTGAATSLASVSQDFACAPSMLKLLSSHNASLRESVLLYLVGVPSSQRELADFGPSLLLVTRNDPNAFLRDLAAKALFQIGSSRSQEAYLRDHKMD